MRKLTKKFKEICTYLKSPFRIDKTDLIDFLIDLKETGKVDKLITLSKKDIMRLDKDELIIEFDNVRNRVHSNAELLYTLFPDLNRKWLDKLTYEVK